MNIKKNINGWYGLNLCGVRNLVEVSCGNGNEPSGSIICQEIFQ
jgi:hypothetical protein